MRGLWLILMSFGCKPDKDTDALDTDVADTDVVATGTFELGDCDAVFSPVQPGETSSARVVLLNGDTVAHHLLSATTTAPFVATGSPVTIGPGSTYQFSTRFAPTTWGDFSATLEVVTDLGTWTCTLTGSAPSDLDGDGYAMIAAGGDDCDDADPDIHPGAYDQPYDGLDADCDGSDDFDQDGDGWEVKVFNPSPEAGGGDCDDVDATVHPGAADPVGGLDLDCDGTP